MKFLSLFTGIGGFDSGFEAAGMINGAMCEIDKYASMVLRYHWPDVEILKDVRKITRSTLSFRPDVICGGFPCQDLSVAGKRKGMAGKRSGLWFEFRRIIEEFKPRWVVVENVPGLFSSQQGRDFAVLLRGLDELGYVGQWKTFDSQYFGVAQRRRRVFIIGHLGERRGREILFESKSLQGNPAEGRKAGQGTSFDVANSLEASCSVDRGDSGHNSKLVATYRMKAFGDYVASSSSSSIKNRDHKDATDLIAHTLRGEGHDASEDGTGRRTPLVPIAFQSTMNTPQTDEDLCPTIKVGSGCDIASPPAVCFQQNTRDEVRQVNGDGRIAGCLASEAGMKQQNYICTARESGQGYWMEDDVSGPLRCEGENRPSRPSQVCAFTERTRKDGRSLETQEELAYALTNPGSGGRPHSRCLMDQNMAVRRLTPRECERLQGFSDDWTRWGRTEDGEIVEISDTQRYKMLGNAVTRTVGEWIGRRIVKAASELEEK